MSLVYAATALESGIERAEQRSREPWRLSISYPSVRLGSAEESILSELRRIGGPVPRRLLVSVVFDSVSVAGRNGRPRGPGHVERLPAGRALQNAESTLSRALGSLQRKGLVMRTFNRATRQTLISVTNPPAPPSWEQEARSEEAFAGRCDAVAAELTELARRARMRVVQLRIERGSSATSLERSNDLAHWTRLLSLPSR